MHALNLRVAASLEMIVAMPSIDVEAVQLPDSVNRISGMPPAQRAWHLPIVTTVDFRLARAGGGPDHHRYDRPSPDLYMVAPLYDVGLGVQVRGDAIREADDLRGKRVGVPPRPSAVRLLTEALLRDGWGVLDDVELVSLTARDATRALASGEVDATCWNLVVPGANGHAPILPVPDGRYLPIGREALANIHAQNGFCTALTQLSAGLPPLLSFAQGIAAWRETPANVVRDISSRAADLNWPGIEAGQIHPALRRDVE